MRERAAPSVWSGGVAVLDEHGAALACALALISRWPSGRAGTSGGWDGRLTHIELRPGARWPAGEGRPIALRANGHGGRGTAYWQGVYEGAREPHVPVAVLLEGCGPPPL